MRTITEVANDLLRQGLSVVPCSMPDKRPLLGKWAKYQTILPAVGEHTFHDALGIITGKISGIFVVDIDLKYDNTGTLLQRLQASIGEELWSRVESVAYIQRTVNGGLHIFLRSETIGKNEKLARRYTTPDEMLNSENERTKVLIETRGEGGFIVCAPTKGYECVVGSLTEIGSVAIEDQEALLEACRSLNEVTTEVNPPASKSFQDSLPGTSPWEDYNARADVQSLLLSHGWTRYKQVGENVHYSRPGKTGCTSGTYHVGLNLFRCFTTSSTLEPEKSYAASALFTHLECNGDFTVSARRLYERGFGRAVSHRLPGQKSIDAAENVVKNFRDYIIREEPVDEEGILTIAGVNVLSQGNVLLMTGPPKSRKTMLASVLTMSTRRRTAYIDTEQGKKHSFRTGKFTPNADVFHLRGEGIQEIKRVVEACVECGDYRLIVIDNVRDMVRDFNKVEESSDIELFLKKISQRVPVIVLLHENKNSATGQGHVGHGLAKIAQTVIRVQLFDTEDPSKGSVVECVSSRDEPFKKTFLSMAGVLSDSTVLKAGGKSMLQQDFFKFFGSEKFSNTEIIEKIADIFSVKKSTARNSFAEIRRAIPEAFEEIREGKQKFYQCRICCK